jgi:4-diphosphocytidyl-2-C-methyl-D-erythritol kinase
VATARAEPAPAKVNLTLHVVGRRADGYHDIESLVVFAREGDALSFAPGGALGLEVEGPTAAHSGDLADNLVLKAARALAERVDGLRVGHFVLSKRLPVAAGLGGGSADAAAALRLLARANHLPLDDPRLKEAARVTGADIPVCLDPRPRWMRGVGEMLSEPVDLPRLPAVLVNPRVAVPTKNVFAALDLKAGQSLGTASQLQPLAAQPRAALLAALAQRRNDLEAPAVSLQPVIAEVLSSLRALAGCDLARMSGSGATCFGLFATSRAATAGAQALRAQHPAWWIRATVLDG